MPKGPKVGPVGPGASPCVFRLVRTQVSYALGDAQLRHTIRPFPVANRIIMREIAIAICIVMWLLVCNFTIR